jgi:hypothetical protein
MQPSATRQRDGQITSDFQKSRQAQNQEVQGKSAAYFRPSHPMEGRLAIVTNVR